MADDHGMSRRTTLKHLATMGAAVVVGGPAASSVQGETARSAQESAASVADVAVGRMAKGHS